MKTKAGVYLQLAVGLALLFSLISAVASDRAEGASDHYPASATPVAEAFAPLGSNLVRVWGFNAATKSWQLYDPAAAGISDLTSLNHGQGYWLEVKQDQRVRLGANEYNLFRGWNLIGWLDHPSVPPPATITPAVIETYQLRLNPGWNLISLPVIPVDPKASVTLPQSEISAIGIPYDMTPGSAIQKYIWLKNNKSWEAPDYPLQFGVAYFLNLDRPKDSGPVSISIFGIKPVFPFSQWVITRQGEQRIAGIGVPTLRPVAWRDVGIYNLQAVSVQYYDSTKDVWVKHSGPELANLSLEPGRGYLITTERPGALVFYERSN